MKVFEVQVGKILTRTSGYLSGVTSHSLQPYCGCSFGKSLCGVGCYVRHNRYLTRGREWGEFLEVRSNAAESYRACFSRERAWSRKARGRFSIFMSSATDPFVPQEARLGITAQILRAMQERPPDELVVQTHSHRVTDSLEQLVALADRCRLRVHVSIESDRDSLPGLPPPASSVAARFAAIREIRRAGLIAVVAVAPLLPLRNGREFLSKVAESADAIIIDHYLEGDGTETGWRTRKTQLPEAIARVNPEANSLEYRDSVIALAREVMPGRVGVGREGFAGRFD